MKYKKTFELVDQLISQHIDEIKIRKRKYDFTGFLPYGQKECTELLYRSRVSDLRIWVELNDLFLKIHLFTPTHSIARLTYKKEESLIFDPKESSGCSKLTRVNKNILIPEIEKG